MNFLNPFALFFGLLAGLIVLMYLLKLRRRRLEVSSTLLWQRSLEDLIANAPFQKLRQNPLMYLQILLLLLLALALARPTLWLNRNVGASRVILIDNSASMNAMDGAAENEKAISRLDAARATARRLVANMAVNDQAIIISFGGQARVNQTSTGEKGLLNSAIDAIPPTDAAARIQDALVLAQGVRKVNPAAGLTIISDGGLGSLGAAVKPDDPIEFLSVGRSAQNLGIVSFDIRESFNARSQVEAFAEVRNYSGQPAEVLLRCLIDGQIVQTREGKIEPRGLQGFVLTGLEGGNSRLLRLELDKPDLLAADNAVQGFINLDDQLRILLVSQGNFFLERMLALLPKARVEKISPAGYQYTGDNRLVIFDHFSPPSLGPGRYFFLNAMPNLPGFALDPAPLKEQVILDWNRLHPVTRFAKFENLAIGDALRLKTPEWTTPLIESAEAPLVLAGENQGVRLICANFDIYAGDWPLQVSFPIFFANAVQWLAGAGEGNLKTNQHRSGETITIENNGLVDVTAPAGEKYRREPDEKGTVYFDKTLRTGLYEVTLSPERKERFAINLLSPEESDITPRQVLAVGERQVAATSLQRENREIWPWFLLAGLALLAAEWHLYCRRSWL